MVRASSKSARSWSAVERHPTRPAQGRRGQIHTFAELGDKGNVGLVALWGHQPSQAPAGRPPRSGLTARRLCWRAAASRASAWRGVTPARLTPTAGRDTPPVGSARKRHPNPPVRSGRQAASRDGPGHCTIPNPAEPLRSRHALDFVPHNGAPPNSDAGRAHRKVAVLHRCPLRRPRRLKFWAYSACTRCIVRRRLCSAAGTPIRCTCCDDRGVACNHSGPRHSGIHLRGCCHVV